MWSYSRRKCLTTAGLSLGAGALTGCGFSPVYKDGTAASNLFNQVQIGVVRGRFGFELRERLIESNQTQIEVDEPEDDAMALQMGGEADKPAEDDMSEEKLLRALMEAQGQP